MPLKNRDEYNTYMRNYYRNKKLQKDLDATQMEITNKDAKSLIELGKDVFKDPNTGETDKVMKYIEQGAKYLPIIMKFFEGFTSNMQHHNQQMQEQQKHQKPKMLPPEGWEHMSSLEKLKYKHTRPAWYEAGLKYDSYKESGEMTTPINTGYVDPNYTDQPRRGQIVHDNSNQPNSLKDLSKRYPEPPLIKDQPMPEVVDQKDDKELHDPKMEQIIKEKQERQNKQNEDKTMKEDDTKIVENDTKIVENDSEIIQTLQQDNAKYIKLTLDYLNKMDFEEFKTKINDIETVVDKQLKPLMIFVPVHVRDMLRNSSDEELLLLFKENCKEKYEWCEKEGKVDNINRLFTRLREYL